ncbi:MAG: LVIVD repeat-containing protein [Gaiellaceae bacterium]
MTPGVESACGLRLVAHSDLGGCGDGMQVLRHGDALYVGHFGSSGMGTTVLDVRDPARPRVVEQWPAPPGTHTHKVQVADGLLLVNQERFRGGDPFTAGMLVLDVADPLAPRPVGRFESGGAGVHRIVWTGGRYAHASVTPAGFADRIWMVIDMSEPQRPVEAARFVLDVPEPAGARYAAHHALVAGELAYLGYCDAGMVVLDVSDFRRPRQIARLTWESGGETHTCLPLPGRSLVVTTDEQLKDGPGSPTRLVHVLDVEDPARPRVLAACPEPEGDFRSRPLRYGPHNLHENRAGSYRSESLVFVTYFNAGVRVYDLADPERPVEVASWVPEAPPGQEAPQTNDLYVEQGGRIWVTDRFRGGLYCLEPEPELAALMHARSL